jgi:integrase
MNVKNATQMPLRKPKGKLAKTDSRYWAERIYKPVNSSGVESAHWMMRHAFKGKRVAFGLRTGNKDAAARIARGIYLDILALGLEGALAKHKPDQSSSETTREASIGEWIAAAKGVFDGSPATFGSYVRCLILIAGDILSVSKSRKRFAASSKSAYRLKIEGAPLSILNPSAVQEWRIRFVAKAGKSPAMERTKKNSANSIVRQASSLFSKKILKFISGVRVPAQIPFEGCEKFPRQSMKYTSTIDPEALLAAAGQDLAVRDPEAFTILLLALGAGLRRGEIDRLLWRQVDFDSGLIRIEATEVGGLKSEDSAGAVPIEPEVVAILRGQRAKSTGVFVVEGAHCEGKARDWGQQYRCGAAFDRLNGWLRANGVDTHKPLHTLRKEAGSLIATQSGIHAASRFLRHADIQVTAMHYADHKERLSVGIGAFLRPKNVRQIGSQQGGGAAALPQNQTYA